MRSNRRGWILHPVTSCCRDVEFLFEVLERSPMHNMKMRVGEVIIAYSYNMLLFLNPQPPSSPLRLFDYIGDCIRKRGNPNCLYV
jgi:hypothetical protein